MTAYHIEGMGLMGCLIASGFERDGIPFTWSDNDSEVTAWRASTGCVFPTGEPGEIADYHSWINMLHAKDAFGEWIRTHMERGLWTYISVAAPHGGAKVGVRELARVEGIAVSNMSTIHMNVPAFVEATRTRQHRHQRPERPEGTTVIISHGFRKAVKYGWGWSCQAKLEISDEFAEHCDGARPCLYLREGYVMHYAYPFPMTDRYIIGTQNVQQSEPAERDTEIPYLRFLEHFEKKCGEQVKMKKLFESTMTQGWRPYATKDEGPIITRKKTMLLVRPQSGNGLRNFPTTYRELLEAMS